MRASSLLALALAGAGAAPTPWTLSEPGRRALDAVSADSLRGHLSFLASDTLGGRTTPSLGQDVAAEYIAAQFRRAGLEPLGDDGYFQTAPARVATPRADGFRFRITAGEKTVDLPPEAFHMLLPEGLALAGTEVVKRPLRGGGAVEGVAGRVVLTDLDEMPRDLPPGDAFRRRQEWIRALLGADPALVVALTGLARARLPYFGTPILVEPAATTRMPRRLAFVEDERLRALYESLPSSTPAARADIELAEPVVEAARLRNVAAVLPGSDPALKATHVLVTAHYDGTGPQPGATGEDRVWNAANDDGSGTVALLELAAVLSRLQPRPRRSIAFVAFFGEEKGLLGSVHYAAHPLVPLGRTVANVNLEHLGRTDSTEAGTRAGTASLTGFDYSDVPAVFQAAGRLMGVDVYKDPVRSDPFYTRSDNYPLARAGVVAHTLGVVFEDFPDYHGPDDEWPKIDFPNYERTVRLVGAAALMLADASEEPQWRDRPETRPYREAWDRLRAN